MPILKPDMHGPREAHYWDLWTKAEVYQFYARMRRENCTYLQLMDLWLQAPVCSDCIQSKWWYRGGLPQVMAEQWEDSLGDYLDAKAMRVIQRQIKRDAAPTGIPCSGGCGGEIRPWDGEDLFVDTYHLEEHYGIDLETPGRVKPSKDFGRQVTRVYGGQCFNCGDRSGLHIDHIRPRTKGGDAAFRNLQPLCQRCGDLKGDTEPGEIGVYSTMYFAAPPSDAFEGLFWED